MSNVQLVLFLGLAVLGMAVAAPDVRSEAPGMQLKGRRVAILVTEGFEQPELVEPRKALDAAGAQTAIVSPHRGAIRAWNKTDWGNAFTVDVALDETSPDHFDALLLPGGVINPDKLRMIPEAVAFVKAFADSGKPIAAICHGPWTLVEAGVVKGRRLTSWPSLITDIRNAGGSWEDAEVIVDRGLVTSRKPDDIPAFNRKMIELFAVGADKKSPANR